MRIVSFTRTRLLSMLMLALSLALAPGCFVSNSAVDIAADSRPSKPNSLVDEQPLRETAAANGAASSLEQKPVEQLPPPEQVAVQGAVKKVGASDTREELFKDWPKPKVALVLTGQQHGYIEPCGCTGLANQKGGLARRHTLLAQLTERGWELAPLDVGNQVRRFGRQSEIQFQMTLEGLKKMNYRAVAFGPDDLRLSTGELIAAAAGSAEAPSPYITANVTILDPDLVSQYKVVSVGEKKIGITAVLVDEAAKKAAVAGGDITISVAAERLAVVWPKLKAEKCDLYVLLSHATIDESKALAAKFPDFHVVVTAGGAGEPTLQPEKIPSTNSVLVQVGTKGMYVGVLGLFDGPGPKLRYQRVPLDDRYADSKDMLALLASYQEQLKTAGLDGLGVKPLQHASGRGFVGSESCADCHTKAYEVWKNTPHAKATESLVHPGERSEIARHFDPECLSCHVTGWNPQKYYPYKSGYLSLTDKSLHGNGCENCHGPGSAHVAAETDAKMSAATLKMLRTQMRLPLVEAEKQCMDCHDLDNSPDFHLRGAFEKYWKAIEHKGLD